MKRLVNASNIPSLETGVHLYQDIVREFTSHSSSLHIRTPTYINTLTHAHTHTHIVSLSLSLSHTHAYTPSIPIHTQTQRAHTHTHTHTQRERERERDASGTHPCTGVKYNTLL